LPPNLFGRRSKQADKGESQGRLPPGQHLTNGWPVLSYGSVPRIDLASWSLSLTGLVEQEVVLSWDELLALPRTTVHCDIHCVTAWSRLDNDFTGVRVSEVLSHVEVKPEAKHVMVHAYGGYTTNLPLDEISGQDCLFAFEHDGEPLTPEHGGPLRLLVPSLYLWKSAKWVRGLEFIANVRPGFWEMYGYHIHGDPWKEERYS
jgi:DMSO/TMAO reductase YedYZ molybdopterin-dependent catalytic subunit